MMSLLSVTVKKARYVGAQASQFNTYVTLKLQNVKSTTVTVKGATPCWEQDFLFETNDLNTGLLIEVWSKGMIWDRAMGYHWIPLQSVQYSNEEGSGQWLSLEAELVMRDAEVVGTKMPTGHSLLVDCRFELPFDPENIEASDLQRKLEMLNNIMDQEARAEQARRQLQYFGHSGYSEDSDYTSDLNYPVGQHANSSASQFRSAAHQIHTPQRSLETSRENSYERDDAPNAQHHHLSQPPQTHQHHLSPGTHRRHHQRYSPSADDYSGFTTHVEQNSSQYQDNSLDSEPLFYNSRPRNKQDYSSQEAWVSCESSFYNQSVDSIDAGYSVDADYYGHPAHSSRALRRPSLERQTTLYDDVSYYGDSNYYRNTEATKVNYVTSIRTLSQNPSCDEYFDSLSYPFQEERYGQDEEDRQWDSGGYFPNTIPKTGKKLPTIPLVANHTNKRRSSTVGLDEGYPVYEDQLRPTPTPTGRRRMPKIPTKRSTSRQSSLNESSDTFTLENSTHRGASLPPTPTKNVKVFTRLTGYTKPFNSLPPTPGRQLPKPNLNRANLKAKRNSLMKRTSSADYADNMDAYDSYYTRPGAVSARETYNEDYNYAYQSIENLADETQAVNNSTGANANYLYMKNGTYQDVHSKNNSYSNYYYNNAQDDEYDYDVAVPPRRKKFLGKRDVSPLLQQNTDSLESRDDELKDSFETAVSSMSSSLHQLKSTPYSEYSTAGEAVLTNTTPTIALAADGSKKTSQYLGEQVPGVVPSVTVAQVHDQAAYRTTNHTRGLLKQQDSVDSGTFYPPQPSAGLQNGKGNFLNGYDYRDQEGAYLEPQESVESYVEDETEDTVTSAINAADYNNKAISHDSPSSVIHVEPFDDHDHDLRRGSSQITVVDPYHPSLQRSAPSRRSSGADAYPRRTSSDAYPGYEDQFLPPPSSRKPSVAEPVQPRRGSLRVSPSPPDHHLIAEELVGVAPDDELPEKNVSFEEEEEQEAKEQRPQVTAQQRWLWAYNKIIMQLNVST